MLETPAGISLIPFYQKYWNMPDLFKLIKSIFLSKVDFCQKTKTKTNKQANKKSKMSLRHQTPEELTSIVCFILTMPSFNYIKFGKKSLYLKNKTTLYL